MKTAKVMGSLDSLIAHEQRAFVRVVEAVRKPLQAIEQAALHTARHLKDCQKVGPREIVMAWVGQEVAPRAVHGAPNVWDVQHLC